MCAYKNGAGVSLFVIGTIFENGGHEHHIPSDSTVGRKPDSSEDLLHLVHVLQREHPDRQVTDDRVFCLPNRGVLFLVGLGVLGQVVVPFVLVFDRNVTVHVEVVRDELGFFGAGLPVTRLVALQALVEVDEDGRRD